MNEYYFVSPLLKRTTKNIDLLDINNNRIGSIQRFYTNKFMFVLDTIFANMFVNVEVFDEKGSSMVKALERVTFKTAVIPTANLWNVSTHDNSVCILKDKTKIKTHPRYEFEVGDKIFRLKKNLVEKTTYLENKQTGNTIAEITYQTLIPPMTIKLRIIDPEIDVYTVACIYYVFSLRD
ncbi:tubby C-terminal domain-like protein [Heyndrickxia sporothermodurans]|uniref:Tubby C-terminal domain-containing protein n=1 Tax=Heyndrickxia sporothermodurans TaxID=46224 RepID=A0A150KKJ8_9BACI|nr:hypothetical protein [Heyndrickxia sporothermodurans]KYC88508.1 hypothetical protein B4102_4040 [Heyndrickxia sporothermodurans]